MKTFIIILIVALVLIGGYYLFFKDNTATGVLNNSSGDQVYCTMDAKLCPDGSYVGRVPPSCEFKACPSNSGSTSTPGTVIDANVNAGAQY